MIHASSISVKMEVTCWVLVAGAEPTLFGKPKFCCMRLHYRSGETSGYFHTLRAVTRNPEDDGKGLIALCDKVFLCFVEADIILCFRHFAVHS